MTDELEQFLTDKFEDHNSKQLEDQPPTEQKN
jgi:hypothetical protein